MSFFLRCNTKEDFTLLVDSLRTLPGFSEFGNSFFQADLRWCVGIVLSCILHQTNSSSLTLFFCFFVVSSDAGMLTTALQHILTPQVHLLNGPSTPWKFAITEDDFVALWNQFPFVHYFGLLFATVQPTFFLSVLFLILFVAQNEGFLTARKVLHLLFTSTKILVGFPHLVELISRTIVQLIFFASNFAKENPSCQFLFEFLFRIVRTNQHPLLSLLSLCF
jgi:hypothetical protein